MLREKILAFDRIENSVDTEIGRRMNGMILSAIDCVIGVTRNLCVKPVRDH